VDSIVPASPLPAITEAVTIDGYTQAGARPATTDTAAELKIRINGANAGRRANGLRIEASDTTVTGLVINRFKKSGILLDGAAGSDIVGNYIGTDQTGRLDHGNRGAGVRIVDGVGNAVGGDTDPALRNLIAWNRGTGVRVEGASAGNSVVSNQILRNSGLGIDLGAAGVTPNDAAPHPGSDTGANNLQNFPEITSATRSGSTTTVAGTLQSTPGQTYTIQCYLAAPDRSGHGEARALLDQDPDVTTDGGGNAGFTCTSDAPMVGDRVSATATCTTTGDTSEFSGNVTVR
jgi:hypothetical protein